MKIKSFGLVLVVVMMAVALSGCGCFYQQMKGETPAPAAPAAKAVSPEAKAAVPVTPAAPAAVALKDINFDFDKYNIRANDAEILKQNYSWMQANRGKQVKIEGNCDERGTVEYNLVLGQKRADAAKNFLVNLGADGKSIGTVSYGKEKPLCAEHNEACWAKNRRAHFVPAQ
jgi:peptidoglycan-associated lipoprotein